MTKKTSRAEIYDAVWSNPMEVAAAYFEIAPSTLSKICKQNDIPVPGRGHWTRVSAGDLSERPRLPARPGEEVLKIRGRRRKNVTKSAPLKIDTADAPIQRIGCNHAAKPDKPNCRATNYYVSALQDEISAQLSAQSSIITTNQRAMFRISILPHSAKRVIRLLDQLCGLADYFGLTMRPSANGLAMGAESWFVPVALTETVSIDAREQSQLEFRIDDGLYGDGIRRRFVDYHDFRLEDLVPDIVTSILRCVAAGKRIKATAAPVRRPESDRKRVVETPIQRSQGQSLYEALMQLEQATLKCRLALSEFTYPSYEQRLRSAGGRDAG